MRKIVLKVLKQIVGCNGVDIPFIRESILGDFFKCFWVRRMAV